MEKFNQEFHLKRISKRANAKLIHTFASELEWQASVASREKCDAKLVSGFTS